MTETLNDLQDDEKIARITNQDKSKKARQGHKKYGSNYRRGHRSMSRDRLKGSLKDLIEPLKEVLSFEQE